MSEATELTNRLRACANGVGDFKTDAGDFGLCDAAADLIERQNKVIEEIVEAFDANTIDHMFDPGTVIDALPSGWLARARTLKGRD